MTDYEALRQSFEDASKRAIEETGDAYKKLSWFPRNIPDGRKPGPSVSGEWGEGKMNMSFGFSTIFPSEILPPDFFAISDWNNPKQSAEPEWHKVYVVNGIAYAHPSVISKIERTIDES